MGSCVESESAKRQRPGSDVAGGWSRGARAVAGQVYHVLSLQGMRAGSVGNGWGSDKTMER